jgi:nucleotide-binding universal stress UspA family protein
VGTIVVGVDGSESSRRAFRFALDEARLRGATVKAVLAWALPFSGGATTGMLPELVSDFQAEAERSLAEAVAEVGGAGEIDLEQVTVEGGAGRALLEAAEGAELLVVGSHGRGGFKGLLLGSVSQQCAHHATCPVVIVPHDREE